MIQRLVLCLFLLWSVETWAGEQTVMPVSVVNENIVASATDVIPQVGKHVGGEINALTMILALFMVLGVIFVCALVLKRLQPTKTATKGLKIITSLHLGAKERLIVVQVGDKQQLLGVTAQQITLLDTLEQPLEVNPPLVSDLGQSFISMIQKTLSKKPVSKSSYE